MKSSDTEYPKVLILFSLLVSKDNPRRNTS